MLLALTGLSGPSRHWLLLIQDYLFYGLLFVSGPVGVFSTLWSAQTLTCVPLLDCSNSPQDSALCLGKNDTGKVWQHLPPDLSQHLNDLCVYKLPFQRTVLIAYVLLFGGAVALWLLHTAWLRISPYSGIANLYGQLDNEQRKQIPEKIEKIEKLRRDGSATEAAIIPIAKTPTEKTGRAIADLLDKKCWPNLRCLFPFVEFVIILSCFGGGYAVKRYVHDVLAESFTCTLSNQELPAKYTSIRCSLYDEVRYKSLYIICASVAFAIGIMKLGTLMYICCKGGSCCGTDVRLLNILLEESDTPPTNVTDMEIQELKSDASRNMRQCIVRVVSEINTYDSVNAQVDPQPERLPRHPREPQPSQSSDSVGFAPGSTTHNKRDIEEDKV